MQFAAVHYFTKYDSGEEIPFPEIASDDEETVSKELMSENINFPTFFNYHGSY